MLPSILTLNISRPPADRAKALLEYLWLREEQVLVLTETGWGGGSGLIATVCRGAGYQVESSLVDAAGTRRRPGAGESTAYGVLVISRGPDIRRVIAPDLPLLTERVLVTEVATGDVPVRLLAVYGAASDPVRYASSVQRQRKRDWLLGFLTWLSELPPSPTVIVGDLNIVAPGHTDTLPYVLAEERTAYDLLTSGLDYRDAYADAHAGTPAAGAPTWVDHSGAGCRYDYVLLGAGVPADGVCTIDPAPLAGGLTDHAALSWRP